MDGLDRIKAARDSAEYRKELKEARQQCIVALEMNGNKEFGEAVLLAVQLFHTGGSRFNTLLNNTITED